jgi:ribosomal protein L24E
MLLVMALFAAIFGWRAAVEQGRLAEGRQSRKTLRMIVSQTEGWMARIKRNPTEFGWTEKEAAEVRKQQESGLAQMKAEIEKTPE